MSRSTLTKNDSSTDSTLRIPFRFQNFGLYDVDDFDEEMNKPGGQFDVLDQDKLESEMNSNTLAPKFVRNCFVEGYTQNSAKSSWDFPETIINDDLDSEGPCGLGGEAKQQIMKSLFSIIFTYNLDVIYEGRYVTFYPVLLLSFAANLSDWDRFKTVLDYFLKTKEFDILRLPNISQPDHPENIAHLISAVVVGCRNFQMNHFQELVEAIKFLVPKFSSPKRTQFILELSNHFQQNLKIISTLLNDDQFFFEDFQKCDNFYLKFLIDVWKNIFNKITEKKIDLLVKDPQQNISLLLNELQESSKNIISTRMIQFQLFDLIVNSDAKQSWNLFEKLLSIAQQKLGLQIYQHKPLFKLISNYFFSHTIPPLEDRNLDYFKNLPKRIPEHGNVSLESILNIFLNPISQSLGLTLEEKELDGICSTFADAQVLESYFKKYSGESDKIEILNLILDHCIPPNPFPSDDPHVAFWAFVNDDSGLDYWLFHGLEVRLLRFFEFRRKGNKLFKKYFPFIALKEKLEK